MQGLLPALPSSSRGMLLAVLSRFFHWPSCRISWTSSVGQDLRIPEHRVPWMPSPLQGSQRCAGVRWDAGSGAGLCYHELWAQPVKLWVLPGPWCCQWYSGHPVPTVQIWQDAFKLAEVVLLWCGREDLGGFFSFSLFPKGLKNLWTAQCYSFHQVLYSWAFSP